MVFAVILSIAAKPLIGIFIKTPEIIDSAALMLRMQQIGMIFMTIVLVTTCVFQSIGQAVGAFLLSISRQGILYVIVLMIALQIAGYYGVIASQAISDFLTAMLALWLLKRSLY